MKQSATITITTGPDRGKAFEVGDDLVHIGRGPGNQIVLSDPTLHDHEVSIVRRNDRYAIYSPVERDVVVEGTPIPSEKWVWLPDECHIQLSRRTALQFEFQSSNGADSLPPQVTASGAKAKPAETETPTGSAKAAADTAAKPGKKNKTIARFITDGPGDPLVRLGADGHLPELKLQEGPVRDLADREPKKANPLLLVGAMLFSMLMSVAMLFLDFGDSDSNTAAKAEARRQIVMYYGDERGNLKPYQHLLREARQARSRGDRKGERQAYRRVLDLLDSEAKSHRTGLTGNPDGDEVTPGDKHLRKLIVTLMSP
jgi:hypothetical protein